MDIVICQRRLLTELSLEESRRLNYCDAMHNFFHIFDGSELHPDDVGNKLPSLDCAKCLAEVVAVVLALIAFGISRSLDPLKKGGEFSRSSPVVVADEKDDIIFACGASKTQQRRVKSQG